jgi:hypothetical protein
MPSIYARKLKARLTWYARVKRGDKWVGYDTGIEAPSQRGGESEEEWRARIAKHGSAM